MREDATPSLQGLFNINAIENSGNRCCAVIAARSASRQSTARACWCIALATRPTPHLRLMIKFPANEMATDAMIGKRRAEAVARIEQRVNELGGKHTLHLPTHTRYGGDMLIVYQLEAIADYLETIPAVSEQGYGDLKNAELIALMETRGLDKGSATKKQDYIDILEAADKAAGEHQDA